MMAAIEAQYKQHPSWSVQLHYDNLRAAFAAAGFPSYTAVGHFEARHRKARGKLRRGVEANKRLVGREVYLDQTTEHLVRGFSQALMRRALPARS